MTPEIRAVFERLLHHWEQESALIRDLLAEPAPETLTGPLTENLTWEQALAAMKEGKAVTRAKWTDKRIHIGDHLPHYTMTEPTGVFATVLKDEDINATDWLIVPEATA